ncbi:MAG TPA: VOC family protein [Spongiibacteraceae bacterium]|nr:VOC family protein [Spongiibacteraceae bacterium]
MNNTLPPSVAAFFPDVEPVWPSSMKAGKPLSNIDQISLVVSDIDAAIEYFGAAFGWGPFYIVPFKGRSGRYGEGDEYALKMAFTLVGTLEIELLEVLEGDTVHRRHLAARGEGVFQLRVKTEHLEEDLQALARQNIKPEWDAWVGDTLVNACVDSHRRFGLRIELIRATELLHSTLRATQAAAAAKAGGQ